jgi:N-acetylneuraminate synthase
MAFDPYANGRCRPFVIAEIGINHNGDVDIAKKMVDMAKNCGADAVKFQKRTIDIVYSKEILDAFRESPWGLTVREQKEGLELSKSEYDEIDNYCREKRIYWSASAWDEKSQKFLNNYGTGFNKIASAMVTHKKLLEMVAKEGKHTFISAGMCTFEQLDRAVRIFEKENCPFTLLHCVSTYPCPDGLCNIERIETLQKRYKCPVGYSGH